MPLSYRDFPFPLSAFVHVLQQEEGEVPYLHYALFEHPGEPFARAQERSTELLLARLPPPPADVLEVGIGMGTTLARLERLGYGAEGITPDPAQAAVARERIGGGPAIHLSRLEDFTSTKRFQAILFQESSQYIDSDALFRKARELAADDAVVLVLDEFALRPVERPGALHRQDRFLETAKALGFVLQEEVDLSAQAAPTVDYFLERLPRYRDSLVTDLGVQPEEIDALIESGKGYRDLYRSGDYGYRLLRFEAPGEG